MFRNNILNDMIQAIKKNDVESVKELILEAKKSAIDLNTYPTKYKYGTVLHFSVLNCRGHASQDINAMIEIINELSHAGVDVNKPGDDSSKCYPIHSAARRAMPVVVNCLLKNGAKFDVIDAKGMTPKEYVEKTIRAKTEKKLTIQDEGIILQDKALDDDVIDRLIEVKNILQRNEDNLLFSCHLF